jgi:chemotaxis signal transduction protein
MGNQALITAGSRQFLIFSLCGLFYALDLNQVAEVCDPPQLSPAPLVPGYCEGVLNTHGDIVAIINLAQLLALAGASRPGKLLVLNREGVALALAVDSVVRIIPEADITFIDCDDNCFATKKLDTPLGTALQLDLATVIRVVEDDFKKGNRH